MKILWALVLCLLLSPEAHAVRVQILHTNDLHSYFVGTRTGKGGYARLKTLVDSLKAKAQAEGLPTLFLDGGDFGEGTSFFLTDGGVASFKMLDTLGIDAAVLGNHDHMQGGRTLADQLKRAGLKTKIVSANLKGKAAMGLTDLIPDMVTFTIQGVKIGVMGLSTSDLHYQYPLLGKGSIAPPTSVVAAMEKKARSQKVNYLIALTHIGVAKDRAVIQKSKDIDLVIGGHSHTRLEEPVYAKNLSKKQIPIVQTGANTVALGELILDIDPKGQKHQLVSYQLHDVTSDLAEDAAMVESVNRAKELREAYLGRPFEDYVGESLIPLSGSVNGVANSKATCWGAHVARATREAVNSDIGMHLAAFEGEQIPAGSISFGDLVDNFPHFRNFGDRGWKIATVKLRGGLIKKLFDLIVKDPKRLGMNMSGAGYDKSNRFAINGMEMSDKKSYVLAMPAEVPYAIEKIVPWLKGLLYSKRVYTEQHYWDVMETYLRSHSPLACGG